MVEHGTFEKLDEAKRPGSFLARSDAGDVARVEDRVIAAESEDDAGPTNNWCAPAEIRETLTDLFRGCSEGRDVRGAVLDKVRSGRRSPGEVQLTELAVVVVNMQIMARMGKGALDVIGADGEFVPCLHSIGAPLGEGQEDVRGRPTPTTSTSSTSPRPARSGRTARAMAATRC